MQKEKPSANGKKPADGTKKSTGAAKTPSKKPTKKETEKPAKETAETPAKKQTTKATAKKPVEKTTEKPTEKEAEDHEGAVPPVLWENTLPKQQNAERMAGYSEAHSLSAVPDGELPVPPGEREVGRASVPVNFPEGLTKKSVARRILVLLLMVAVLGAATAVFFFRPAEYTEKICSVETFYNQVENNTFVIADGKNVGTLAGRVAVKETDGRGLTALLLTEGGELWLVRGGKMRAVSDGVTRAALSAGGGTMAFRTLSGALYRSGTGRKDTPELVSNETKDEPFCLSPDGKELLYTSVVGGTPRAELFSARGSAPYLTDTGNYRPVAIADKCRYIYFRDAENTLYIYNADTARMTNCGSFAEGSLVFNRDLSEVLFGDGATCRFYRHGTAMTLTGLSAGETLTLLPNRRAAKLEAVGGVQVLQKSLLGCYYDYAAAGGNSLVYLRAKKDMAVMDTIHFFDNGTATVTDKYVFFISTDQTATDRRSNLYAVKNGKTACTRLMADVAEYCTNVDGSRLLYRDAHGPLRAMRMGSAPTQLADGFLGGTLCVTLDDVFYYRTEDGALYRSENGDTPEKVADGVRFAAADAHVAFFLTENGGQYELYTNYRGKRRNTPAAVFPAVVDDRE